MKLPCGLSARAARWASKRSRFSARPTGGRGISSWPTKRIALVCRKAADSYLKIDRVISAAEIGNVQALHPGYGFLSENAHFNEVCRSCNIDFIGPTPDAMSKLGDKNTARKIARDANVPVVPGSEGLITNEKEAVRLAHEIGFPVLIKATAGGGGRGMRVASNDLTLEECAATSGGRGGSGVWQRGNLFGALHRTAAACRSADSGRSARQRGASCTSANVRRSGGIRS